MKISKPVIVHNKFDAFTESPDRNIIGDKGNMLRAEILISDCMTVRHVTIAKHKKKKIVSADRDMDSFMKSSQYMVSQGRNATSPLMRSPKLASNKISKIDNPKSIEQDEHDKQDRVQIRHESGCIEQEEHDKQDGV